MCLQHHAVTFKLSATIHVRGHPSRSHAVRYCTVLCDRSDHPLLVVHRNTRESSLKYFSSSFTTRISICFTSYQFVPSTHLQYSTVQYSERKTRTSGKAGLTKLGDIRRRLGTRLCDCCKPAPGMRRMVGARKRIRQSIRIDLLAASGCCNRGRRSNLGTMIPAYG